MYETVRKIKPPTIVIVFMCFQIPYIIFELGKYFANGIDKILDSKIYIKFDVKLTFQNNITITF